MADDAPHTRVQPPADLPGDPSLTFDPNRRTLTGATGGPATLAALTAATAPGAEVEAPTAGPCSEILVPRSPVATEAVPRRAEPGYELRRRIGRGGMGEVWEALQVSLNRTVAVKRIRRERLEERPDLRPVLEREFRQEAHVAARLEHPNIIPVHDLGTNEQGEPLLAMKMVHGRPWDAVLKADFGRMPVADFLALHLPVLIAMGQAVAFAHAQGIIHRDLKPSQVMVGEFGEVLLMDWGLAVYVGADAAPSGELPPRTERDARMGTEDTLPTRETASSPSGTPALMAPEQTLPDARSLGPWTDVYLLGGTLHYVLTGKFPHDAPTSAAAFLLAANGELRDLREHAPGREMPQALVDLCRHALARDPKDRIASAKHFVERLQDFLSGASRRRESAALTDRAAEDLRAAGTNYGSITDALALLSRAATLWPDNGALPALRDRAHGAYAEAALGNGDLRLARLQAMQLSPGAARDRLLARVSSAEDSAAARERTRRMAIAAVILSLVVIVLGGAYYSMTLRAAREEALEARDRADAARLEAERQRDLASAAQRSAQAARGRAEDLISFMLGDLNPGLQRIGKLELLKPVADKSIEYFRSLDREEFDDSARLRYALSLMNLGRVMTALGETTYTLAAVSDAYEAMGKLAKENPDSHRYRYERGRAAGQLGEVYRDLGNFEKAMACFEEFRAAATEAHAAAPESDDIAQQLAQSHMRIGAMLRAMGQAEKAIPEYAEAIRITGMMLERSPSTDLYRSHSSANSGMFITYCDLNRVREGISYAQASIEASEKAYALSPSDTDVIRELAVSYSDLGYGYYLLNGHEQAIPPYQRASELSNLVAARDPLNLVWAREAAIAETFLADGLDSAGRTAEAQETYRRTVQRLRDIVLRDPTNQKYRMDLAIALTRVGRAATTLAQFEEAITSLREAAGLIEALALETPDSVQYRFAQAATMEFIGDAYHSDGRPEEAFAAYDRARAIKVGIAEASPAIGRYWSDAASSARLMLAVASKNAMPDKAAEAARYQLEYSLRSAEAPDPESTAPTLVARAAAELAMALDQLQPVPADERAQAVRKGLDVAEATGLQRPSELSFYALLLLLDGREAEAEPMLRRLLDSGYDPGQFWLYPPTRDWLERNGLTPPEPKGPDGTSGPAAE